MLTLDEFHDSFNFTMELENNGKLPFLRLLIMKNSSRLDTKVYAKPETVVENTIRHFAKMKVTGDIYVPNKYPMNMILRNQQIR